MGRGSFVQIAELRSVLERQRPAGARDRALSVTVMATGPDPPCLRLRRPGVTCPIDLRVRLARANWAWVVDPCPVNTCQSDTPSRPCPIDTCHWGTGRNCAPRGHGWCPHPPLTRVNGARLSTGHVTPGPELAPSPHRSRPNPLLSPNGILPLDLRRSGRWKPGCLRRCRGSHLGEFAAVALPAKLMQCEQEVWDLRPKAIPLCLKEAQEISLEIGAELFCVCQIKDEGVTEVSQCLVLCVCACLRVRVCLCVGERPEGGRG